MRRNRKALNATMRVALLALATPAAAQNAPPPGATSCFGCHPPEGFVAATPPLAGLAADGVVAALRAFRDGERPATVMDRIAKGFSDDEIDAIAEYLAALPPGARP